MNAVPIVLALFAALLLAACEPADGDIETLTPEPTPATPSPTPTPAITPTPTAEGTPAATATPSERSQDISLEQTCVNEEDGYRVDYPADWHTNPGTQVPPCSYFDPEPFTVPPATEFIRAINVRVEEVAFGRVSEGVREGPMTELVEAEETTVDGRDALVAEMRTTEQASLLPPDTRFYQYVVDLDGRTLIAVTHDLPGHDFDRNQEILDEMMQSLRFE